MPRRCCESCWLVKASLQGVNRVGGNGTLERSNEVLGSNIEVLGGNIEVLGGSIEVLGGSIVIAGLTRNLYTFAIQKKLTYLFCRVNIVNGRFLIYLS